MFTNIKTTRIHNCVKLQWCTKTGKKVMAFDIHVPIGAYGLYMSNITSSLRLKIIWNEVDLANKLSSICTLKDVWQNI